MVGDGPRAPMARGQSQGKEGDLLVRKHALPSHGIPDQEGGNPLSQDKEGTAGGMSPEEGGDPP